MITIFRYKIDLTSEMIVKSKDKLIINHEFEYLDLKNRNSKITNPKTELIYEYEIINEGLLRPNKTLARKFNYTFD